MFIKGIGHSKFTFSLKSSIELACEVIIEAINNSKMELCDLDAIVVSNIDIFTNGEHQRHTPGLYSQIFKLNIPIIRIPAACASGSAALFVANKLGYDNILVVATEKLKSMATNDITEELAFAGEELYEQEEGLNFPAQNALIANIYMKKYGVTEDDLNLVAMKNYEFAKENELAFFSGKSMDLDKIKSSPLICTPLRLHHCSISVDGAVAVVLTKKKTDVEIVGSSLIEDSMSFFERDDFTSWKAPKMAAQEAYKQAGIGPNDLDVVELHDAFSSVELIAYEDLGFCNPGDAKYLIRNGETSFEGRLPVNTSGGLKAKGHPISVTGLSQIAWLVKQLRGEAGKFQVKNPIYALAHNVGGVGTTGVVHILKKV
ncbi:MAG: thiolase family protein [Nanoarchaeota archaeon]|nr:thiolase family protein [Nanoarchaeota archaeon]